MALKQIKKLHNRLKVETDLKARNEIEKQMAVILIKEKRYEESLLSYFKALSSKIDKKESRVSVVDKIFSLKKEFKPKETSVGSFGFEIEDLLKNLVVKDEYEDQDLFYGEEITKYAIQLARLESELPKGKRNSFDLNKIKKEIPQEKKFKKLFHETMGSLLDCSLNYHLWSRSCLLIKSGINKDLVYNDLSSSVSNLEWGEFSLSGLHWEDSYSKTEVLGFIKTLRNWFSDKKVISFILKDVYAFGNTDLEDLQDGIKSAKKDGLNIKNLIYSGSKTIEEAHDVFFDRIETESLFKKPIVELNQREDFLKIDGKEFKVNGTNMVVHVPKTNHDLYRYSQVFNNCVGSSGRYLDDVLKGKNSIVGVFDENKKPLYCIQTSKYSFIQALGVNNQVIPKNILIGLEEIITMKPELPKDFTPVSHSFIFGYSYNPKKSSLFLMFKKTDAVYEYENVPESVYEEFVETPQKGHFLNSVIKKYSYHKAS